MTSVEETLAEVERRRCATQRLNLYRRDFEEFARDNLRVIPKDTTLGILPFVLNPAQRMVHDALEKQRRETGMVRAIILKARRQGMSTYVAARYYHAASMNKYKAVAIVAHIQKTVGSLYRIVKRFHENNPLAPRIGTSNVRELVFDKLDSRYSVFSAETGEGGRGEDCTHLHFSEFAYYKDPNSQLSGIGEAIPDTPGTEIIIESTAKEATGVFYDMCMDALHGRGKYILIFVPYNVSPEYAMKPPAEFEVETEPLVDGFPSELELMEQFGLNVEQIAWRRWKMGGPKGLRRFTIEYPLSIDQAFQAYTEDSLIKPADVMRARKAKRTPAGPLIFGVDPASMGGDRFAVAARRGSVIEWVKHRTKISAVEGAAWVKSLIDDHKPDRVFVDAGGVGDGVCSILYETGPEYRRVTRAVNFGSNSQHYNARPEAPGPVNRRAEMWGRLEEWLTDEAGAQLPDDDSLLSDMCAPIVKHRPNGNWLLESKKNMKERSTDLGDACALTFADLTFLKSFRAAEDAKTPTVETIDTREKSNELPEGCSWMAG